MAGLEKSKRMGRVGGRPTLEAEKVQKINKLKTAGMNVSAISKKIGISRTTVYQYLEETSILRKGL